MSSSAADEQQVSALFEYATEGMVLTDQRGNILLANPAALHLFHYTKEELLGSPIETLIPSRFHGTHVAQRDGFYQAPSNRAMGHGRDLFAKTKDGQEFPVEVSLSYFEKEGERFAIAFIIDITSRKQAEQEVLAQKAQLEKITFEVRKLNADLEIKVEERTAILKEALIELEKSQNELHEALGKEKELSEIKSRFVSMASHEFRTPLSTILSSATLIGKYTQTDEQDKRDKHIYRIKDSVKHLNNLLEDFLSLGKLEEGHIKAVGNRCNVREFVLEIVDELRAIMKKDQQMHCDWKGEDCFTTDKHLLKNILLNLLSNAVKFSPEGASIWLQVEIENNKLHVSVKDEGIGISEEDQQHLFSSFFRGKNVINIEGTGLGLHIVKRYVTLLEGDISLSSQLGQGTTVVIHLNELTLPS